MIKRYLLTAKKEDKIENEIFFEMHSAEEMQLVYIKDEFLVCPWWHTTSSKLSLHYVNKYVIVYIYYIIIGDIMPFFS